jgi:hypothetical protein
MGMEALFFTLIPTTIVVTLLAYLGLYWCFVEHARFASSILWAPLASYAITFGLFWFIGPRLATRSGLQAEFAIGISYVQMIALAVCSAILLVFRRLLRVGYTRSLAIADATTVIAPFLLLHSIGMIAALADCVGHIDPECYMS